MVRLACGRRLVDRLVDRHRLRPRSQRGRGRIGRVRPGADADHGRVVFDPRTVRQHAACSSGDDLGKAREDEARPELAGEQRQVVALGRAAIEKGSSTSIGR